MRSVHETQQFSERTIYLLTYQYSIRSGLRKILLIEKIIVVVCFTQGEMN